MIEFYAPFATLADDIALAGLPEVLRRGGAVDVPMTWNFSKARRTKAAGPLEGHRRRLQPLEYTEAISVLQKGMKAGRAKFENTDVTWGIDLDSEHERYLTEKVYKGLVVLINYPGHGLLHAS